MNNLPASPYKPATILSQSNVSDCVYLTKYDIRHTAVKPQERMKNIKEGLRPIGKDEYAKEFGISIEDEFMKVAGRYEIQQS